MYPALAVAATLAAGHDDVVFVGTPDGLEARLVPEAGVAFRGLASKGFDRSRPLSFLSAAFTTVASTARAWAWLGRERVDVVMGFGGYVSLPVGMAAVLRGIPLVLHEQNSVPGLANRVLARWAYAIGVTYEDSMPLLPRSRRTEVTGNPVRGDVLSSSRDEGRRALGLDADALVLLIFGGSRGARHLNQAVVGLKDRLLAVRGLSVVHVAGPLESDTVSREVGEEARWQVFGYIDAMGDAIAAADLVVCRAGATTIAELTALGAPAVVVPYPYATDDHQTKNAATLVRHGAAALVTDAELDTPLLGEVLLRLLGDDRARANMSAASQALARVDAAEHLASLAREAACAQSSSRASRSPE